MQTNNPNQIARCQRTEKLKNDRRLLLPSVLNELKSIENGRYSTEASLNAFIGQKIDDYIDVQNDIIKTPMEFQSKWLSGLNKAVSRCEFTKNEPRHARMKSALYGQRPNFRKYVANFLEASFLKHYEAYYKVKPKIDETEYWFGNNNDEYGLLVTPRYVNLKWENDKSEIRKFKCPYWTISHVLETGLCYLKSDQKYSFSKVDEYLNFFRSLVRRTASKYQMEIAEKYIGYVKSKNDALSIPLLIPELRYTPDKQRHEHRLDFLIINPWNMSKIGFELSPWSSHGQLTGAHKSLKEHNDNARGNFEKEMEKHKKYWRKYGINYVIYTDKDLVNMDEVWSEMLVYLNPDVPNEQFELHLLNELFE